MVRVWGEINQQSVLDKITVEVGKSVFSDK